MATPEVFDLESVLQPISQEVPGGVELKEEPAASELFYRLKSARDDARSAEKALENWASFSDEEKEEQENLGQSPPSSPDWDTVVDLAREILADQSKDLWVAAWLIEALARTKQYAGLRDGFRMLRELAEQFWDDIHPRPDEDEGYAYTVAQLTGLNGDESEGALIMPIERIPITPDGSTGADYKDAVARGGLAKIESEAASASPEYYQELSEDLDAALEEFDRMNQVLDEKCGQGPDGYPAAPPSSAIRQALEESRDRVRSIARDILKSEAEEDAEEGKGLVAVEGEGTVSTKKGMTREDAFRALLQVAEYFRRTEPHSPVSYALEQAVRWGRMSLPDLLAELISDSSTREELFRRTGIPEPERKDDEY
jgi:type VI secretion system protein ImpA